MISTAFTPERRRAGEDACAVVTWAAGDDSEPFVIEGDRAHLIRIVTCLACMAAVLLDELADNLDRTSEDVRADLFLRLLRHP